MTFLKWIAIILAAGYCAGLILLFAKQRSMLFPIPTAERIAPAAAGFPQAEEHVLTTSDGEKVIVWHVPPKPGHSVVLFFHGNGDFLAGLAGRFKAITADGTGLVGLSFRGYAGSSGAPSEDGLLRDGAAAYAFAAARYDAERIIPWGFSLGTGVAVAVASEHPIRKLILEAPYTSIADVVAPRYWFAPVRLLMRDPFHSDERIGRVTVPLLIVHGAQDQTVPIAFGEKLFALAHEPKQFVRIPAGGHDNLGNFGMVDIARQFINGP